MRRFKQLLAAALMLLILFVTVACDGETEKVSKTLSTYTITAEYSDTAHALDGSMRLDFINNYEVPLETLEFHLYGQAYRADAKVKPIHDSAKKEAYPNGESYGGMTVSDIRIDGVAAKTTIGGEDQDILIVQFQEALYPKQRKTIDMQFTVTLADIRHRLGYHDRGVNLGNFYPVASVYESGAFRSNPYYANGDPFFAEAANYRASITFPEGYKVATTGAATTETVNGKVLTHATADAVRDFAIVASKDFHVMQDSVGDVTVNYYYYEDSSPEKSLKAGADSIRTFSEMFGQYPYPTFNVVQTGFLHGGMEYPGLVYISDTVKDDSYLEVIIHETAHQWWYGIVGSDAVNHAWQDEGLTDYSTTLFYDKNPSYNITKSDRIMASLKNYLVYVDVYSAINKDVDTSMDKCVKDFRSEFEYSYMTYIKGEIMFDTLRTSIGEKAFEKGLQLYFRNNKYAIAAPADMIGAFETASHMKLTSFFDSWLNGKVMIG